jgi:N-acetylneuraminate synthase/N,N'-diacetyllegionaminate synthase
LEQIILFNQGKEKVTVILAREEKPETIKKIETSMGDGKKVPVLREIPERFWARRGIYAKELIRKGEVLTFEKFKFLRPCRGVPAENFEALCGKILKRDIYAGEPISFEDV